MNSILESKQAIHAQDVVVQLCLGRQTATKDTGHGSVAKTTEDTPVGM